MELEPNQTHRCDEPEPNPNILTQVLVGFDKFGAINIEQDFLSDVMASTSPVTSTDEFDTYLRNTYHVSRCRA